MTEHKWDRPTAGDLELKPVIEEYARQGHTAETIAALIPGKTRPMIYGTCHRLGISLGGGKSGPRVGSKHSAPPPNVNEEIEKKRARHRSRYCAQRTCLWHGCSNETKPGKPYCSEHNK